MLKDSKELVNDFLYIINEDDLSIKIAEEFIERDAMKGWEQDNLF
jgi:hypothetical protein